MRATSGGPFLEPRRRPVAARAIGCDIRSRCEMFLPLPAEDIQITTAFRRQMAASAFLIQRDLRPEIVSVDRCIVEFYARPLHSKGRVRILIPEMALRLQLQNRQK